MNSRKRVIAEHNLLITTPVYERCTCQPLHSLAVTLPKNDEEYPHVLITEELRQRLQTHLQSYFVRSTPLSILVLHLSQLEHTHITSQVVLLQKRRHYHAPQGIFEQVLVNVRRAIRENDILLVHEDIGAVLVLPDVDQQGISSILERIYNSITLLQAETIIPPLRRETSILLGIGTTTGLEASMEDLFIQASHIAREFRLRPAINTQSWNDAQPGASDTLTTRQRPVAQEREGTEASKHRYPTIPFMLLPATIPVRLKPLLPHKVALQLRCAPVGRNHHYLTVAMSNPTNSEAIEHLQQLTGMTVFPVSCDDDALDRLLDKGW